MKRIGFSKNLILLSLLASAIISSIIIYNYNKEEREQTKKLMATQASEITNQVNEALQEVYGVQALVLGASGKQIDLQSVGTRLIHKQYRPFVQNILIAPDGIVEQVYPKDGNEEVIGQDLITYTKATSEEEAKVNSHEQMVVVGPYDLAQGGKAISGRIKVMLKNGGDMYQYWGMVAITLNFPQVMEQIPKDYLAEEGCAYKISKRNAKNKYDTILAKDYSEGKDNEMHYFDIHGMHFKMETYPLRGWVRPLKIIHVSVITTLICMMLGIVGSYLLTKQKQLIKYATIDELTGLVNRSSGEKQINHILGSTSSHHFFLLIDIDHFKLVNDTLGHQIGDEVIAKTAKILKTVFRESDIKCRLGGDEFVVFLPIGESREYIKQKVERLLKAMDRDVVREKGTVHISCSIGIASAPDNGTTFDKLYQCADRALYYAKENGRNQVSYYQKHGVD